MCMCYIYVTSSSKQFTPTHALTSTYILQDISYYLLSLYPTIYAAGLSTDSNSTFKGTYEICGNEFQENTAEAVGAAVAMPVPKSFTIVNTHMVTVFGNK